MVFKLDSLPYDYKALEPFMSEETLQLHHDKHHQTYVTNLNNLLENSTLKGKSLEEIVVESYNKSDMVGIFNNAAQDYNHRMFWESMKKGVAPSDNLKSKLAKDFGSFEDFRNKFIADGLAVFGSGWVWLAYDKTSHKFEVLKCPNGLNPLALGKDSILGCDVWEHSYYVDYRNVRKDYLEKWFDNLVNWDYVEKKINSL